MAMAARQGVVAALVLLAGVSVAGCKSSSSAGAEEETNGAAKVTAVQGKDGIHQVELTSDGAQRIGLETGTVRTTAAAPGATTKVATTRLSVPLNAVLYDKDGATWVYVSTGKFTYRREAVRIASVSGDTAILSSGPTAGTTVVTVGAAELLGAEDGVPGE
jgi:hypothetical protein